ncbi:MAG: endonuclease/exonuclease/phosphatase family protein [Anaerolineae bacterium]|nr:endonuclease/exonuclease/phosphatase family protein [Anaerolineae bacterium]
MNDVRLLDLNIWNVNEPWIARRERIVELIGAAAPDVVALQEVRYCDWTADPRHQADQIADALPGYRSVWQPAHYWQPGHAHNEGLIEWEGLAILSAHPIVDQALLRLSRDDNDDRDSFQRLVLGAQVRAPAGPTWVFNTHYPLSAAARTRVAAETLAFVERVAGGRAYALTGDLNAEPEEPPIRHLLGGLTDAWTARHPGELGYTYPAWGPFKRIDYVLVPSQVQVCEIEILGAVPNRETVSPSDHCAILATLAIPGS